MTTLLLLTGLALLAVALSVGRRAWRGEFDRNPFVGPFLLVVSVGAGAAIYLAIGGV